MDLTEVGEGVEEVVDEEEDDEDDREDGMEEDGMQEDGMQEDEKTEGRMMEGRREGGRREVGGLVESARLEAGENVEKEICEEVGQVGKGEDEKYG